MTALPPESAAWNHILYFLSDFYLCRLAVSQTPVDLCVGGCDKQCQTCKQAQCVNEPNTTPCTGGTCSNGKCEKTVSQVLS